MTPDLINAIFEGGGTFFLLLSTRRLYLDKMVRGIDWRSQVFFTSWGLWNVFYYPHLGQLFSFVAGIGLVAVNILYVAMIIYYIRQERQNDRELQID